MEDDSSRKKQMAFRWILVASLVLSLVIIPKIAFYTHDIHDSFNYSNSALAQTAINDGEIKQFPYDNEGNSINRHANGWSVRWVVTSSIASVSLATGMAPRELQSIPICAFGILVFAYLVASKLTKDWRLASLYTVILAFDPTVNSLTNGTYIQGWGFIFYFMLVYLIMVSVEKQYYLAILGQKAHYSGFLLYSSLIACCLVMMYFSYYATLVYGVAMLAIVFGGVMFNKSEKSLNRKHVAIFIIIATMGFAALYYFEPTVRFAISNFQDLPSTFFDYMSNMAANGGSSFYIGIASYILILIPICALGYKYIRIMLQRRCLSPMNSNDIIIVAFAFTGIVNVVMYTGLGLVDFKYIIMFFSLASLYAVKRMHLPDNFLAKSLHPHKIPIRQLFAFVLAILFVMKFVAYIAPVMGESPVNESVQLEWISQQCVHPGSETISDLKLSGNIMLLHAEKGNSAFNSFIFSANYLNLLLSGNRTEFSVANGDIRYIIMTLDNMAGHFNVGNWETWSLEENFVNSISQYRHIQKIYSSADYTVWLVN